MSPDSSGLGPARPSGVVNEDIRALIRATGRRLTDAERTLLEGLYVEWAAAIAAERDRPEIVEAA